ncbi:MAG: ImmA/IrrE family metallo-endopeptidase [Parvibaculum sp.]|uniref:ImmA/IrrE family metallo-endopeptidase n=1 Tax=Parvibaculum sp. TaxID=2024848 RepID=UPI0032ECE6BA
MASADYPSAIRTGVMAASRLLRELDLQSQIQERGGNMDVFAVFQMIDLPVLIRPLKGLLGAYMSDPDHGVLITTERPMSIQRWTAAHELGHYILKHKPSLDDEDVLRRMPMSASAIGGDFQEDEANAFASAFLMPRWLMIWHAQRQGWTIDDFQCPAVVYQLSLRLGTSYEATCWTLARNNFLALDDVEKILKVKPRDLKVELLRSYRPEDYKGDVWLLTKRDAGTVISGSHNDLFVLRLPEHSTGGYLWNVEQLNQSGFVVFRDETESLDDEDSSIGGPVIRRVTVGPHEGHCGRISIDERRPWDPSPPVATLALEYDLTGPEIAGLSRAERRFLLDAA